MEEEEEGVRLSLSLSLSFPFFLFLSQEHAGASRLACDQQEGRATLLAFPFFLSVEVGVRKKEREPPKFSTPPPPTTTTGQTGSDRIAFPNRFSVVTLPQLNPLP